MKTHLYTIYVWAMLSAISGLRAEAAGADSGPFTLSCPAHVTVSCTADLSDLDDFGTATIISGNHTYPAGHPSVSYHLNSCQVGTITRTWMEEDMNGHWHSCSQTITVTRPGHAAPTIYWPADVTLQGCNPNTNPYTMSGEDNFPTWDYTVCSMLGRSYSDMEFFVNSQCRKIMRTWKVVDWCDYSPYTGYKIYQRVQTLFIMENTPPVLDCPAEITINSFNCKDADVVVDPLTVTGSACGGQFQIFNNSKYALSKGANISGKYPIGTTRVTYTVRFGCGMTRTCHRDVVVINAAKPTPYCIREITTALMPVDTDDDGQIDDGMVEIHARNFDHGSFSSCGYHPLRFSFSKDVLDTKRILTCDEVGTNEIELWVTDSRGGQNYCTVILHVQNNGARIPDCQPKSTITPPPPYSVNGAVTTLTDTPVQDVYMTLEYPDSIYSYTVTYDTTETLQLDSFINHSGYKLYFYDKVQVVTSQVDSTAVFVRRQTKTDSAGFYVFDSLPFIHKPVRLYGHYEDDSRRFIDSKDVELLTRFLLGEVSFTSYPQYLASDVNEDGLINNTDLNLLMDFVNGVTDTLPGTYSWYVLDKNADFSPPESVLTSPLPFDVLLDSVRLKEDPVPFTVFKKGNISIDQGSIIYTPWETRVAANTSFSVKAYPNPFRDQLQFDIDSPSECVSMLYLYDVAGKVLNSYSFQLNRGLQSTSVSVPEKWNGLLIYKWVMDGRVITGKVVKTE